MISNYNLSDKDFHKLRDIIYDEAGIKLGDVKKILMQSRLIKRLRDLRLDNFTEYYEYLIQNYEKEKINFINSITTNKTDFFRENDHFEFMKSKILPDFEKKKENELRIWSAGCSTGEEPYTIAITLFEYFNGKVPPEFLILATDIDTQVLEKAQEGNYSADHLADVEPKYLKNYFFDNSSEKGNFYKVKDQLKQVVYFRRLNLLQDDYPMKKKFDIIFCRNVIIYFDRETQKKLFENYHRYLKDDGYLLIGHSENITSITDKFSLTGRTIYKKVV
ncbi:MAG TPA: protein-glutamate O-methyltransferase [Spirochaetota bacterium]|nr:protein-glutamate O-methyltransferase [Spirochaetota bacterium]HPS87340.1 protein-glutamate O-methyltransferase [Spirochaetota bacterium]